RAGAGADHVREIVDPHVAAVDELRGHEDDDERRHRAQERAAIAEQQIREEHERQHLGQSGGGQTPRGDPRATSRQRQARDGDECGLPQLDVLDGQHAVERTEIRPQHDDAEQQRRRQRFGTLAVPVTNRHECRRQRDQCCDDVERVAVEREPLRIVGRRAVHRIEQEQEHRPVLPRLIDRRRAVEHLAVDRLELFDDLPEIRIPQRKHDPGDDDVHRAVGERSHRQTASGYPTHRGQGKMTLSRRALLKSAALCAMGGRLIAADDRETLYNGITLARPWPPRNAFLSDIPVTPPYLADPPAVIPIDVGRQLFVDDFLIEERTLERDFHHATYHPASPVFRPRARWETYDDAAERTHTRSNPAAMPFSDGVFYDPRERLFKMWYMGGY